MLIFLPAMPRRRRRYQSDSHLEAGIKAAVTILMLLALGIGGVANFLPTLLWLVIWIVLAAVGVGGVVLIVLLVRRRLRLQRGSAPLPAPNHAPVSAVARHAAQRWTAATIRRALDEIDWYQFEKFCAALLVADGVSVRRSGGAHPDGGVDLLAEKFGARSLIQCKHWRTWLVQERIVRELLGSMTHFGVQRAAIYTLKGRTEPAAALAASHQITLANGEELAAQAARQLTPPQLDQLLRSDVHHCPRCESPMILRTGAFGSFWGCYRYPACRGKLKSTGVH